VDAAEVIAERKRAHLELALAPTSQSAVDPGWDDVHLLPLSLPELSLDQVDLGTSFFGHRLDAPIVLVPMTGGHPDAAELNAVLGEAAARLGLAVGVGSQRAALGERSLARTFSAVRDRAPDVPVLANIGACQLVAQGAEPALTPGDLAEVVDMVRADVLSIHLNVVQELVQPEGDRNTAELAAAIAAAVDAVAVPVLVKETGAGMTHETAMLLAELGVAGLDVGGAGGTSFARIEATRAEASADEGASALGRLFGTWGVPTVASLLEVRRAGLPVVATGGVRHGLDAAKALALGARAVGVGRLAIEPATRGVAELVRRLEQLIDEVRMAFLLSGARTVDQLQERSPVVTGFSLEWARQRRLL
jgi:isopentenyl-diphosphate Delta-isomerase